MDFNSELKIGRHVIFQDNNGTLMAKSKQNGSSDTKSD